MKHLSVVVVFFSLFLGLLRGPSASAAIDTLVASNSVWKYFDLGTDLGTNWTSLSFDDSTWASGPGQLGYGDGDEATVVSFGPDPNNKFITTYFRQTILVANPAQYAVLSMKVQRDDGVVIHVNGREVFRDTLPPGEINFLTPATGSVGDDGRGWMPIVINVPPGYLQPGANVLAAEIHQQSSTSSDITFALELIGNTQNEPPTTAVVSPTENTFYTEPASIVINAAAADSDGAVALVEFFQGNTKVGEDTTAPYSFTWSGVLQGAYALRTVATDNLGAKGTSAVVNVTVGVATPPTIFSKTPAPGNLTSLTAITVNFSEPVTGVDAGDLLVNGMPASSVYGSGSNYTFTISKPAEGTLYVGWNGAHGITDFESPPKAFDPFGAGATWQYTLADSVAPTVTSISPTAGSTLRQLSKIEVRFSEPVSGIDAADLRINGVAATSVTGRGDGPYEFQFPTPANGAVSVAWVAGHGITDQAASRNAFAGGSWNYTLNTNAIWAGNILISEIMFHPSSELVTDEWIELHNRGASAVNLAGWKLNRAVDFVFPSVNLPAGGYLVVAANLAAFNAKYPAVTSVVGGWTGRLSNTRDEIELEDPSGSQVDLVAYADEGDWAIRTATGLGLDWNCPADGLGSSLELRQLNLPNDNGQNWASSSTVQGTPSAANSVAVANLPPMIVGVKHFPVVPRSTNSITVLAERIDEVSTGGGMVLYYRDVTSGVLPTFNTTVMRDDGLSNDGTVGDGIFGTVLPPQANGTLIEFFVEARDVSLLTNTWPASVDQGGGIRAQEANAFIQVDDEAYAGSQPFYRILMRPGERADFFNNFDSVKRNATFITIEGSDVQVRHNSAARRRGASSFFRTPPTFKFDIASDRPWNNKTSINLNSDHTYAQALGSAVALKAGLPTPYIRGVQLRFNGVNQSESGSSMFGSYASVEVANGEYARDHFPLDGNGNVYNKRRPEGALEYRGTDPNVYIALSYSKESNASENDWSDLINLLFAMDPDTTPADRYVEAMRRNANVEMWMRYFAVNYLMDNNETSLSNGADDDYDMYRGILDPRFVIIAHDWDSIFGSSGGSPGPDIFLSAARIPNISRFLRHPDFEPLYYAEYRRQLAGLFNTNNLFPLMDQVLAGWVPAGTIDSMKAVALGRMNSALAALPAAPVVVRATIAGEPDSPTYLNTAVLNVGGADITLYRYRVNNGAWSADRPVSQPIPLSSLVNGHYTVYVVGRNSAGTWQADADATVSKTWAVISGLRGVVINEVLAINDSAVNHEGTTPDYIELFNAGAAAVDLSGFRITDDLDAPDKYTIPAGTTLSAGGYRVLFANNPDATSGLHIGFGLDGGGDSVYLLDRVTNGLRVLDSVKFGWQIANLSIGRQTNGQWGLCVPTLAAANVTAATGSTATLSINEWLASPAGAFVKDFIELYNPDALPVNLGGLSLTDRPIGNPFRHQITPLSFIEGFGYRAFVADGNKSAGPNHVDFSLSSEGGEIGLTGRDGQVINSIFYVQQTAGISEGRTPNGSSRIQFFDIPTPGAGNPVAAGPVQPQLVTLIPINGTHAWKYEESGADLGTSWTGAGYNDSAWLTGIPVFGFDSNLTFQEPLRTPLTITSGKITFYFRTKFTNAPGSSISSLQSTHLIDDGAVFYLNGVEAGRFSMPAAPEVVTNGTLAINHEASVFETTSLSVANLLPGENVLAVEVHQSAPTSGDIVFGMKLDAVIITNNPAVAGIKINEVLANARNATNAAGTVTDWIELYNPSNGSVDLTGMSLTDQLTTPRRWVFPAGSIIAAGSYKVVEFDSGSPATTNASATLNTGFGLKSSGDSLYLFNRPQSGGELLDAVSFGVQAADWSIGRVPSGGSNWVLSIPSQGSANLAASLGSPYQLKINEWMAAPVTGGDWFEIYNPSAQPVELSGLYLTDDLNNRLQYAPFPQRSFIAAGLSGFLKIMADNDPAAGADHVPFALSKNGESLGIVDRFGTLIDQITFGGQFNGVSQGRLPDGSTNITLFTETQSPEESNYLPIPNVVINEVLTHSDPPLEDAIELRNTSASAVNIGGWYLSDARTALRKFRIPNGTTIPANGFRVFYETNFNPVPNDPVSFSLSSAGGDEVYLSATDSGGQLTGFRTVVNFGPAANGVSFGRYITSGLNGNKVEFTAMAQRTFGADSPPTLDDFRTGTGKTNSAPLVGPVVISEIMYHPQDLLGGVDDSTNEYVEIRNITGSSLPLFDPAFPTNTWRLKDAVSFRFPPSTTLPANGTIVIVNFNPADTGALNAFRTKYSVQAGATILGPSSGKLANGSASVELARPDAPQVTGPDAGLVPYILVDKVKYSDVAPWPAGADGTGQSLHRITLANYGNDPINWTNAVPTPGPQGVNPDADGDGMDDAWEVTYFGNTSRNGTGDFDNDGMTDLAEFLGGTNPVQAASNLRLTIVHSAPDVLRFNAVSNKTYTVEYKTNLSSVTWTLLQSVPSGASRAVQVTNSAASPKTRFYRVRTP